TREFAERIFEQIKGFGSYGFPESHAASFALLTWASCWLKQNYPVAFACALVNSQPMGFYSPDQILQDLRRHGGEVRPVDVRWSQWDCSMEATGGRHGFALRMRLRMVRGCRQEDALRIAAARPARGGGGVGAAGGGGAACGGRGGGGGGGEGRGGRGGAGGGGGGGGGGRGARRGPRAAGGGRRSSGSRGERGARLSGRRAWDD